MKRLAGILALVVLAGFFQAQAGELPKPGDLVLGGSLGAATTLEDDWQTQVGVIFEFWADEVWSYQAGIAWGVDDYDISAYSASAWHFAYSPGSNVFVSAGIAAANGTGVLADAGAGLEFFPGTHVSIQLRGDFYYALDNPGDDSRSSYGVSGALARKW